MSSQTDPARRARTRTLIQLGGLVTLSGLAQVCEIEEGENLQGEPDAQKKAAVLLGVLVDASEKLLGHDSPAELEKFARFGVTLLKKADL